MYVLSWLFVGRGWRLLLSEVSVCRDGDSVEKFGKGDQVKKKKGLGFVHVIEDLIFAYVRSSNGHLRENLFFKCFFISQYQNKNDGVEGEGKG